MRGRANTLDVIIGLLFLTPVVLSRVVKLANPPQIYPHFWRLNLWLSPEYPVYPNIRAQLWRPSTFTAKELSTAGLEPATLWITSGHSTTYLHVDGVDGVVFFLFLGHVRVEFLNPILHLGLDFVLALSQSVFSLSMFRRDGDQLRLCKFVTELSY